MNEFNEIEFSEIDDDYIREEFKKYNFIEEVEDILLNEDYDDDKKKYLIKNLLDIYL